MKLTKIDPKDLLFTNNCEDDRTNTQLSLLDYDWMNYTLTTRFRTEALGTLDVCFEYFGCVDSRMTVVQTTNKGETVEYSYNSDIFEKYLMRFLSQHMAQWGQHLAFNGENIVVDFYNEVLENGKLCE